MQEMETLFTSTEFRRLPPAKASLLREMILLMDNRSMQEKVQILLSYGFKMQNQGLALSSDEAAMLMPILEKNLSPEERQQLKQLTRLL